MGPIILREKKMGYFHTENTCQVGLKDLEGHCDEKKRRDEKVFLNTVKKLELTKFYFL